jgi:hypothetical protein
MPGDRGRRTVTARVNQADVLPTLLELVGLAPVGRIAGRSRARLLRGAGEASPFTIAEMLSPEKGGPQRAVLTDTAAVMIRDRNTAVEFYDMQRDPLQRRNVANTRGAEVDSMHTLLRRELAATVLRGGAATEPRIDPDTLRHLQSLGYLQGRHATAAASAVPSGSPADTIRHVLRGFHDGPRLWPALTSDHSVLGDESPRTYDVRVTLPAATTVQRARLHFAAAASAAIVSDVRIRAEAGSGSASPAAERAATFGSDRRRRIPAGAIVGSDPVVMPAGTRWVISFRISPLSLLRVSDLPGTFTELSEVPADSAPTTWPRKGAARVNASIGLVAITLAAER